MTVLPWTVMSCVGVGLLGVACGIWSGLPALDRDQLYDQLVRRAVIIAAVGLVVTVVGIWLSVSTALDTTP